MSTTDPRHRTATAHGTAYRFDRFRLPLLLDDLTFGRTAPGPGNRLPDFDLATLDGGRFRSDALGDRPVLLIFGSRTCPVTESAGPALRRLHAEFGTQVRFVLVNTREAHPGQRYPQPQTFDVKWAHAEELRRHHELPFEVAVDDIDGTLHRALTPKPNSAYLIRSDATIRYRAHWANDERGLRAALAAVAVGEEPPTPYGNRMVGPLLRAVGHLPGVVRFAGGQVERDVWLAAAPLAILGRLSRLFGALPPDARGPAAALLVASVGLAASAVAVLG
ncbi:MULTISPECIES: redoxin domain-containing protein [unclassified Solwaraspora]|uniref:redoxin domain-containing protein n=1 Tax=unclassified Solwaraspora TaxID=2627926 RepID=UPI00259B2112|nr:redoxin domain-containing protein [Solwaraspora sp. WMMA2056]WJK38529.1 redoxin domain-containing protein [Solwaraspora sp. WMMA2056]